MGSSQMFSNLSLTAALFLGALHAFWPGHGKAVLAAYLIGSRGRVIHAIWVGLIIAITHTFTVIVLGFIIKLAYSAIAASAIQSQPTGAEPIPVPGAKIMRLVAGILIMMVGVWLIVGKGRIHTHTHGHEHHHHEDESRQGIWQMLLLGISGGMVPCAEGIALLLMAIAEGQMARGLTLVVAFSLGVAIVIVTIGIIVCKLSSVAEHLLQRTGKWVHRLPVISGSLISLLGFYSVVRVLLTF